MGHQGSPPDALALEAIGISKRFGAREVLAGVDLHARSGRLHGVLGPNGAGKTTLMRVVLGLMGRDAGSVRLLGQPRDVPSAAIPEGVAGFVDTAAFYPYLSGRDNLALLDRLDGSAKSGRRERIELALAQVGLERCQSTVAGYSAGMRQRLGLAAALLRSPRLLVLDEPTSSLDPAGARDVRALIRQIADAGAAIVLSSHDMAEVEELCADLTVIDRGRLVFSGTVDQLRKRAPAVVHVLQTSDDSRALELASRRFQLTVSPLAAGGLVVTGDVHARDAYVIGLAHAGIAVRSFEPRARSLESLFLELTGEAATPRIPGRTVDLVGAARRRAVLT